MNELQRITTEYIDVEDRIRLSGQVENAAPVVIWLTQRLLQRLLPALLNWLERQCVEAPRAEVLHGFVQQVARAELPPQAPVRADAASTVWLTLSVDVTPSEKSIRLVFRGAEGQHATLVLAAKPLRQWVGIVHDAYAKAQWPMDIWPAWAREGAAVPDRKQAAVLH